MSASRVRGDTREGSTCGLLVIQLPSLLLCGPQSPCWPRLIPALDLLAFCRSWVQGSPNVLPGKAAKWAVGFSQARALPTQTRALRAMFDASSPCLPSQMSTKVPVPGTGRRSEP